MDKYKDPKNQRIYEAMLVLAADTSSELYFEGKPRRGAGHRAAFWDGYVGTGKSANVIPGTMSAVCFAAGKQFAITNPGIQDAEYKIGANSANLRRRSIAVLPAAQPSRAGAERGG
jgi:hypothetical protein